MFIKRKLLSYLTLLLIAYSNCQGMDIENNHESKLVLESRNCLVINFWPFGDYSKTVTEIPHYNFFMIADKSIASDQLETLQPYFKKIILIDNYFSSGKLEIETLKINQEYSLDSIIAFDEFDLLRAARLREHLKITTGQSYESALAFRDKFIMKSYLRNSNIQVPPHAKITCALEAIEFFSANPLMILKPIRGAGAEKTIVIKSLEELNSTIASNLFFGHYHFSNLIAEKYIHGEMYNINGFVLNNEIVFMWPNKYYNTCLDMVHGKIMSHYTLSPDNPMVPRLMDYTRKVLTLLPTPKDTAFHLEVFHTEKDELFFCEIASRLCGGLLTTEWESSFGINPVHEDFLIQAGSTQAWDIERKFSSVPKMISGHVEIPSKIGVLRSLPESLPFAWVKKYEKKRQVNDVVNSVKSIMDRVAQISFVADSESQFISRLSELTEWFEKNTKWEQ